MKLVLKLGLTFAAVVALAGCHPIRALKSRELSCHVKQPYMAATSIAPLKIPQGLDTPDTTNALHIPPLNEPAPPPRKGREPCLDSPPQFKAPPKPATPQA
jgi:uncharacterized lipoprotein